MYECGGGVKSPTAAKIQRIYTRIIEHLVENVYLFIVNDFYWAKNIKMFYVHQLQIRNIRLSQASPLE